MKLSWKYPLPKQEFRPFDHFGWTKLKEGQTAKKKTTSQHENAEGFMMGLKYFEFKAALNRVKCKTEEA